MPCLENRKRQNTGRSKRKKGERHLHQEGKGEIPSISFPGKRVRHYGKKKKEEEKLDLPLHPGGRGRRKNAVEGFFRKREERGGFL